MKAVNRNLWIVMGRFFISKHKTLATNKSKQITRNEVGWSPVPSTPQSTKLEGMVGQTDYAPAIRNSYARAEQQNNRSYNNPLGAFTTADVRDKSKREAHTDFMQNQGIDLGNAAQQNQQNAFNQQATVAGLTAPRFYNASSTSSQPFTGGDALGMGLGGLTGFLS